jgi:predicted DNA-binding ArsR family transcriptional regulator
MTKLPIEEFFDLYHDYRQKSHSKVTCIEKALADIKYAYKFSDSDIDEIREEVLDLMEPENE